MGQNQFNDITEDLLQWKKDIPFPASLQNEFRRWQLLWCTKNDVPDTFLHALACCNVDSFPNIYQLLVIACTLPVTSAEAERSFSLLRRLKNYMRSTMSEERMGDLGVIAMHYGVKSVNNLCSRIQGVYSSHHFLWINFVNLASL